MKYLTEFLSPVGTAYNSIVRKRYVVDVPDYSKALKVRHIFIFALFITLCLSMCSCGAVREIPKIVERVQKDTIYLSTHHYDSVFVGHEVIYEPIDSATINLPPYKGGPGRVLDKSIEFRYRKLTDTLRIVQRDSIPYEVTVTEVKEITRPLTWYDRLTRSVFWIVIVITITLVMSKCRTIVSLRRFIRNS